MKSRPLKSEVNLFWFGLYAWEVPPFTLTFTIVWESLAENELMIIFLHFPENRFRPFMQIVSTGDNLNEKSKHIFWEKKFRMSSAELQSVNFIPKCIRVSEIMLFFLLIFRLSILKFQLSNWTWNFNLRVLKFQTINLKFQLTYFEISTYLYWTFNLLTWNFNLRILKFQLTYLEISTY